MKRDEVLEKIATMFFGIEGLPVNAQRKLIGRQVKKLAREINDLILKVGEQEKDIVRLKTAFENRGNLMDMYVQALADISDLPLKPETGETARQMARDVLTAPNPACAKQEQKASES